MGCDIHLYVEQRVGDHWEQIDRPADYDLGWRDYRQFAVLADVRNGSHGTVTPSAFARRGLPEDGTMSTREQSDYWDSDGHSHTWMTLSELYSVDWDEYHQQPGYEKDGLPYLPRWARRHWPEPTDDVRFVFWFDN